MQSNSNSNSNNSKSFFMLHEVNQALFAVALARGKTEPYAKSIRLEVLNAIKKEQEHPLKGEVLEILNIEGANKKESSLQFDERPHRDYELSEIELAQIASVAEWCASKHGRYSLLARKLGLKPLKLRRYLTLVTPPNSQEVAKMYEYVKEFVVIEQSGVDKRLENKENESFFIFVLRSFVAFAIDSAQKHISTGLYSLETTHKICMNQGFWLSNYQKFTIHYKQRYAHKLVQLGLVSLLYKNAGSPSRYMLKDEVFAKKIIGIAIKELKKLVDNGMYISGYSLQRKKLSKSGKVNELKSHLKRLCYEHYNISENGLQEHYPEDAYLIAS